MENQINVMEEPPKEVKIQILRGMKATWINTNYQASQEAHIGLAIGDTQLKARAVEMMKKSMTAMDELDKELAKLESSTEE